MKILTRYSPSHLVVAAALLFFPITPGRADEPVAQRIRVIVDNDFGGDPDGLFQLAHLLLSPSVELRGIIGSHHYPEGFYGYPGTSAHAVAAAKELVEIMGCTRKAPILQGAEERLADNSSPIPSEAARFIVREALREEAGTPLYLLCGAGLTEVASAYLMDRRIASRVTLVWIGGPEHDGLAPPPGKRRVEYNLGIDIKAAQVVFNESGLAVWQVPRDAYRQALVSVSDLQCKLGRDGKTGTYLLDKLDDLRRKAKGSLGETYVLGDSPLVLLTALQSSWEPDACSSESMETAAPQITDEGWYAENPAGRKIRVFRKIDTRLMMDDFFAKMALFHERGGP